MNLNTWYKLSMAVHSTAIDVSVNGVPWEHTTRCAVSLWGSGDIWWGEYGGALQLCAESPVCSDRAHDCGRCGDDEWGIGGVADA